MQANTYSVVLENSICPVRRWLLQCFSLYLSRTCKTDLAASLRHLQAKAARQPRLRGPQDVWKAGTCYRNPCRDESL